MSNYNYVYYTAQINNDASKSSSAFDNEEPNFEFKEDRKVPIITESDKYEMAVESAMFDLKTLPNFIPTIKFKMNPTDLQKIETIYEVTLEFDGMSSTVPIYFEPQDQTITGPPNFDNGMANYKSGYYNLYNYEFFFTMVNTCIRNSFLNLIDVVKSYYGGTLPTAFSNLATNSVYEIPYFIFDKESSLIFLNSPKSTFSDSNTNNINIMLNKSLYRLFNSLPFKLQNKTFNSLKSDGTTQTTINQTLFKLNLSNFKQANEVEIYPHLSDGSSGSIKKTHMLIYQDYETLSSWSPVESIVLISPNFPVPSHQMSASLEYLDGIINQVGETRTEQEILEVKSNKPIPIVIYEPKQYRWMTLRQSDSDNLRQIIFKIFYRFKLNGDLIAVKAGVGGSFSCKLMFRKIR
jgi:hypothetical protein